MIINYTFQNNLLVFSIDIGSPLCEMTEKYTDKYVESESFLIKSEGCFGDYTNININKIIDYLIQEKYLIDWLYIVPELDEKEKEHYHLIIAIKTLVNYNAHVKINLINDLRTVINRDINLNVLYSFEKLSKKFNYILKQSYTSYEKYDYVSKRTKIKNTKCINLDYHKFLINKHFESNNNEIITELKKYIQIIYIPT